MTWGLEIVRSAPILVLIALDHGALRDALGALVGAEPDLRACAMVARSADLVQTALDSRADVVVLDLGMPGKDGASLVAELHASGAGARVLLLSTGEPPSALVRALDAGALGYVGRTAAGKDLVVAIRRIAAGERYEGEDERAGTVPSEPVSPPPSDSSPPLSPDRLERGADPRLSPRERQVLKFVAAGYTNQEAADQLGLSVKTVEGYRSRLMQKLDAGSRVELVRWALRLGLLDDEQ